MSDLGGYQEAKDLIERRDDGLFQNEGMAGDAIMTIVCKKCGSNHFHVGEADWQTVIKCVNCGWELSFHEG